MIPLRLSAVADAEQPYVAKLRTPPNSGLNPHDTLYLDGDEFGASFAGPHGLVTLEGVPPDELDGDVVVVDPATGRAERLLRAASAHNTLLVTERCDQLCVMCSQPPKKTHHDRFAQFELACLLAERGQVIGISGGEPTLYKEELLGMIERVLEARDDLAFHVLTNAQHFTDADITRLRDPRFQRVTWGVPLYAADAPLHDHIVGKDGAFRQLEDGFVRLMLSGARVELRTVLLADNVDALQDLARYVAARLRFIAAWSIMQLEHIGFARNRWRHLYVDHANRFAPIAAALDIAQLHGLPVRLFNFPRCTVPENYRHLAAASISDWKRKYAPACADCREQRDCTGFFAWHPDEALNEVQPL